MTAPAQTDILTTIEGLEPRIRAHADEGERDGRLPAPIVEALREAGLFRLLTPRSLGGAEAEPLVFYRAVEALSRIDGSTGWCHMIGGGAAILGARLPDVTAETVFADPGVILAGAIFPFGRALAAEGGYLVDGRWAFASGCQHANWIVGICETYDGEERRTLPSGGPNLHIMMFPASDVRIVETWQVSGLAGTGSHDFEVHEQVVPAERTFALATPHRGSHYQGALYRFPFLGLFAFPIAAVALGIAQAAIDACLGLAQSKRPRGSEVTLLERPLFQNHLAEAIAAVSSARAWLHAEVEKAWDTTARGEPVELPQRAAFSLAASNAVRSSAAAVDRMYTAGGGTSLYKTSPLQRHFRDIHAVTQHTATAPQTWENAGKILAGLPPPNPMLLL